MKEKARPRLRGHFPLFPVLLALSAWFPLQGGAEENCLWMNAATAGGLLGGAASMSVVRVSPKSANIHAANAISGAGPTSADPDSIKYSGNGIDDSDCTFTRHSGSMTGELRIEVRTMNDPAREFSNFAARCDPHGTALNAIGNEASECAVDGKAGENTEQVVGRVRDRAFVIRLRVSGPSMPPELLREKVRKAAEIVSGNLF